MKGWERDSPSDTCCPAPVEVRRKMKSVGYVTVSVILLQFDTVYLGISVCRMQVYSKNAGLFLTHSWVQYG